MKARFGTYALILRSERSISLEVGRLGMINVQPGFYIYVGSAFGPGGIRARVSRHFRRHKPRHWHIDYLRERMTPVAAWCSYAPEKLEHRWAGVFAGMRGLSPVKGFGCTDCHCDSHLFHARRMPGVRRFSALVGGGVHVVSPGCEGCRVS